MKISIVLSTYNGEKYILDLLKSLLNQTRQADEVLIFDDKSSDGTVDIIQNFISSNNLMDKWKLDINQNNKGWRRNFMEGMWASTGGLVFPCDQDDIWIDTKLETMEKLMLEHPEIEVLTSNYIAFYDDGKEKIGPKKQSKKLNKIKLGYDYLCVDYPGCTYCIRRNILDESKKYWDSDFAHDATVYRLAIFNDGLYSYGEPLIHWRKHSDSSFSKEVQVSRTKDKKLKELEYLQRQNKYLLDYIQIKNKPYRKLIENNNKWIDLRINLFKTKKIRYWFKLFKYKSNYGKFRRWPLDLYITYKKCSINTCVAG